VAIEGEDTTLHIEVLLSDVRGFDSSATRFSAVWSTFQL